MIAVHGKPEPTPNGKIAIRKIIAPIEPILNTHPFSNIDMAINPWQAPINPTANCMCCANHPLMKSRYQLLQVRSAYSR